MRQYMHEHLTFDQTPFGYHGTGLELLLGFLKAMGAVVLIYAQLVFWVLVFGERVGTVIGGAAFYVAMLALAPLALTGTWRYRLSRASLRGIRFLFRGRPAAMARVIIPGALLTMVTLASISRLLLMTVLLLLPERPLWQCVV